MRTVVDSRVAVKWYFPERSSIAASRSADARLARAARGVLAEVELLA